MGMMYLAALKIPVVISDIITTLYLFRVLSIIASKDKAVKLSTLYALNPIVIFLSAIHGTNDPIAIMFTVMAFYYFIRHKPSSDSINEKDLVKSALFLGLGIATKFYPLFLVPIFLIALTGRTNRLLYLGLSLVPIVATSLPFILWDP